MKKNVLASICLIFSSALCSQTGTSDELQLNGVASYEQLRKEYYLGGVFLPAISNEPAAVITMPGKKRMEIRVVIDAWSPRSFSQQWNQAILINNDQETLESFANAIQAFVNLPQQDLQTGDRVTVAMDPERGTSVSLNDVLVFEDEGTGFFDLLLNTWIGLRPPSSEFKNNILTMPSGPAGEQLISRFQNTTPSDARKKTVAGWFKDEKAEQAEQKAREEAAAQAAAAKAREDKAREEAAAQAAAAKAREEAAAQAEAKAREQAERSTTASDSAVPAAPAAPIAEPATDEKSVREIAALAEAAENAAREKAEQDALLKRYRSSIMKLTYLNTEYPKRAMDASQEGLVVVKLKVNRNGEMLALDFEQSTEFNLLNRAAETAVRKSAPYPKVPDQLKGEEIELLLPFNFKL